MTINFAADQFVHSITRRFDQICYPDAQSSDSIIHPSMSQIYSADELSRWENLENAELARSMTSQTVVNQLHDMPCEIQVQVYNQAQNISKWFLATGFLGRPHTKFETERLTAIELSAKQRLLDLGQSVSYFSSPSTQLLNFIFQRVIIEAAVQDMNLVSTQIDPFRSNLNGFSLKFKRLLYKVEAAAIAILKNPLFNLILAYYSYRAYWKLQPQMMAYLQRYVIPKGVLLTIKHAPMSIIHLSSRIIQIFQYVSAHSWRVWLGFLGVKFAAAWLHPRLQRSIEITKNILFFPSTVSRFLLRLPFYIFLNSWKMQSTLGKNLAQVKDRSLARHYQEETIKAYQVWMDLMQNGAHKGIFILPQPATNT